MSELIDQIQSSQRNLQRKSCPQVVTFLQSMQKQPDRREGSTGVPIKQVSVETQLCF